MTGTRRSFLQHGLALGAGALAMFRSDAVDRAAASVARLNGRSPAETAGDEDFWFEIQQAFAVDRSVINLNNGGVSPSPRVVQDALRRHIEFANELPARNLWQFMDPQVETVRAKLARIFGASPDEIAVTRNASESLETLILGMDLRPGDEVITTELDYPRMITAYRQRVAREGIVLHLLPVRVPVQDLGELVELYRRAITPRTKVMLVSHVCFVTGQIAPVRELCRLGRQHGIEVIVDGAHAFAHLAFQRPELECHYYATSLHKWLTAPIGTGMLYVYEPRIREIWPLMAATEPRSGNIRKFEEIGTHPAANKLAIAEAAAFHEAIGPQRKEARLRFLRDRWARRLAEDRRVRFCTRLEAEHSCCLTTFAIDGVEPTALQRHLFEKHRVCTVPVDQGGVRGIRVTPNVYTTLEEIDVFVRAVEEVLAKGLPGAEG